MDFCKKERENINLPAQCSVFVVGFGIGFLKENSREAVAGAWQRREIFYPTPEPQILFTSET